MYALLFLLLAIALWAAQQRWRKGSLVTFFVTLVLMVIVFIPHTIRHINMAL